MGQDAKIMLERMYDLVLNKFEDELEAWDSLVDLVAADHQANLLAKLNHKFEWLHEDRALTDKLSRVYDPSILRADYHDHLGDVYREKLRAGVPTVELGQLDLVLHKWTPREQKGTGIAMLDPAAGTGSLLMEVHKSLPKVSLFGVERDLRAYRIALTNFAIHNIQGYLLHADKDKHDITLQTPEGQYNWKFANQWYSCIDKLKPVRGEPGKSPNKTK